LLLVVVSTSSDASEAPAIEAANFSAAYFSTFALSIIFLSLSLSSIVFFKSTAALPFSASSGKSVSSSLGLSFYALFTSSAVVSSTMAIQSTPSDSRELSN